MGRAADNTGTPVNGHFSSLAMALSHTGTNTRFLTFHRQTPLMFKWVSFVIPIGCFRDYLCLCFKISPHAKPSIQKLVCYAWKWTGRQNAFSYEWFCKKTHFGTGKKQARNGLLFNCKPKAYPDGRLLRSKVPLHGSTLICIKPNEKISFWLSFHLLNLFTSIFPLHCST